MCAVHTTALPFQSSPLTAIRDTCRSSQNASVSELNLIYFNNCNNINTVLYTYLLNKTADNEISTQLTYLVSILSYIYISSSSFPHLFPLSCGVDVSYETPPSSSVLSVLPGQFSLGQVVPDAIQPPPLWSSSPSFPRHLHRHHSLAYVFVFSSQYVPIPLQPTFLYFLGYFSHLRCPSNSFIPNSVQLGDSTHPS